MKPKNTSGVFLFLVILLTAIPVGVSANTAPPVDMFQLPWEQGQAWVSFDGLDNGLRRTSTSPHHYAMGGAIDFAPRATMTLGEDTSNAWVTAAAAGTVTEVGSCYIKMDHGNGWLTEYWHLDNIQVTAGMQVSRNQRLAIIHNNKDQQVCPGNEYPKPHLHFVFRPKVVDARFAGWAVNYNIFTNTTTYTKEGTTVPILSPLMNIPDLQTVMRGILDWNSTNSGTVDAYRLERWSLMLVDIATFEVNVNPMGVGLVPLIVLLDSQGNEITRANGTLSTTQPPGIYYVDVRSAAGTGFYSITATKQESNGATVTPTALTLDPFSATQTAIAATPTALTPDPFSATQTAVAATPTALTPTFTPTAVSTPIGPYVWVNVLHPIISIDETSQIEVYINNIPNQGYASVEFTCTYQPTIIEVTNIRAAELFGNNPATTLYGPSNGQFIFAIAGSNNQRASISGVAFNFEAHGAHNGQTSIQCAARVSNGQGSLQAIEDLPGVLTVTQPNSTFISGQVIASKPITLQLFDAQNVLIVTTTANLDGTFNLPAAGGNYTLNASAEGFLAAQGAITLTSGTTLQMPVIHLPAGDVDGNHVIDQIDALTIGMNYNASLPAAADLNNDGIINILDLELLAANYRRSGAMLWQ